MLSAIVHFSKARKSINIIQSSDQKAELRPSRFMHIVMSSITRGLTTFVSGDVGEGLRLPQEAGGYSISNADLFRPIRSDGFHSVTGSSRHCRMHRRA